jgi:hypothetical protein
MIKQILIMTKHIEDASFHGTTRKKIRIDKLLLDREVVWRIDNL